MSNDAGSQEDLSPEPEWVLKRNCALSPGQLVMIFASLACASLGFALLWAAQGAWLVVPFAVVEVIALGVAFAVYARHAADCERVRLGQESVVIERQVGEQRTVVRLPRAWLRVRLSQQSDGLVELSSGQTVESVGRFVDLKGREQFVVGFKRALQP